MGAVEVTQCADDMLGRLAVPAVPEAKPFAPSNTLILVDWDDTLCPTSFLGELCRFVQDGNHCSSALPRCLTQQRVQATEKGQCLRITGDALAHIRQLEAAVISFLWRIKQLGKVVIVTNANLEWVRQSARLFFPNAAQVLGGIQIVSARSMFGSEFPDSRMAWKMAAFAALLNLFNPHATDESRKLVISVGDSEEERMALRVGRSYQSCLTGNTIKLLGRPSVSQMRGQLAVLGDYIMDMTETTVTTHQDIALTPCED